MIKSVTVTNYLGESLVLELTRPDLSGFIVKDIDGLGPVKANINMTKMATGDGASYNSANLNQRDITFQLQFYAIGDESIEEIRHRSYRYFPLKKQVTIRVETDERISEATGYVESNEPNIFSDAEGCTVVVACPDPYFYSLKTDETMFCGIEPSFDFPFSNESYADDLIELGTNRNKTEANVFNSGDAETGLTIIMHATGDVEDVTIYNLGTREAMTLDTSKIYTTRRIVGIDDSLIQYRGTEDEWADDKSWVKATHYDIDGTPRTITHSIKNKEMYSGPHSVTYPIPVVPGSTVVYSSSVQVYAYDKDGVQLNLTSKVLTSETYAYDFFGWFTSNVTVEVKEATLPTNTAYVKVRGVFGDEYLSYAYQPYVFERDQILPHKLIDGDTVTINTERGKKSISLLRGGLRYNILNCVDRKSKWFTLNKGDNLFAYKAETGSQYLQFSMENKVIYTGV